MPPEGAWLKGLLIARSWKPGNQVKIQDTHNDMRLIFIRITESMVHNWPGQKNTARHNITRGTGSKCKVSMTFPLPSGKNPVHTPYMFLLGGSG
jgi:hypothetical protein